jgi:Ran GTPase-activating protein (RanGAP) involved in mRNA processing and transport
MAVNKSRGVLSLTRVEDISVIKNEFNETKLDFSIEELAFHAIEFNETIILGLIELLEHQQPQQEQYRVWKNITFINCTGQIQLLASQLCDGSREGGIIIENLGFVRNLERFDDSSFLENVLTTMTASLRCFRLSTTLNAIDTIHLANGIQNNTSVESIDFRWTTFQEEDEDNATSCIARLAQGLASNQTLKTLDFSACNLTDKQMSIICQSILGHPTLETLILNSNNCGTLTGQQIATLLKHTSCRIQKLDLSFQQREINKKLECQPIIEALRKNQSLKILDLTCNLLDDNDLELIGCVLTENTTLRELFLARNKFTNIGIQILANQFRSMKGLQKISLWGNKFTEDGALAILDGIKVNTELHTINLFQNFKVRSTEFFL